MKGQQPWQCTVFSRWVWRLELSVVLMERAKRVNV